MLKWCRMQKQKILGLTVDCGGYDDLLIKIDKRIKAKAQTTIVAVNPEKVVRAYKDIELNQMLNGFTFGIIDGVGVQLALRYKYKINTTRVTGVQLMDNICEMSAQNGYKVYMLGASSECIELAKANLIKRYPKIQIVGHQHGYFTDDEKVCRDINDSQADILFVALGSPTQEWWIHRNRKKIKTSVIQGVGGSFDVLSGQVKRAPAIMQKLGLEWLYRLCVNPSRAYRQVNLIKFILLCIFIRRNKDED